jgi:hypothetical protein
MRFAKPLALLLPFILSTQVTANRDSPDLNIHSDHPQNAKGIPKGSTEAPTLFTTKLSWKDSTKNVWKDVLEFDEGKLAQFAKDG